jgi:hypothetical protein
VTRPEILIRHSPISVLAVVTLVQIIARSWFSLRLRCAPFSIAGMIVGPVQMLRNSSDNRVMMRKVCSPGAVAVSRSVASHNGTSLRSLVKPKEAIGDRENGIVTALALDIFPTRKVVACQLVRSGADR